MKTIGGQFEEVPTNGLRRASGRTPIRAASVVLALAYPSTRQGIRIALERHGLEVVAEAKTADDAVAAAQSHHPDLCLLDLEMPGGGVQATSRILADLPDTKIAILTASLENPLLLDAVRAGADGCLLKGTAPDRLMIALQALLDGEVVLPRLLTDRLVDDLRQRPLRQSTLRGDDTESTGQARTGPPTPAPAHPITQSPETPHPSPWTGSHDYPGRPSRLLYMPRLMRHFRHRRLGGMPIADAWVSARARMREYR